MTKVDGGLVNHQLAADYVVSFPDTGNIIVELKGKEIRHACEQILATAKLLERCGAPRRAVGALIVCTRVPSTDSTTSRLKNEFLKKHGTRLHIKSGNLEHDALKLIGK
ncbi:hypothetical protein [Luteibacter sp. 329MFSha]|uniref:hypothetical protein n=1 Tax=Luteibacter sp. 329MFSha TaxID=1798239 RepID=UPI0011138A56|nr:hypothetical protein [Luteibacter sp. 329MFSha]